MMTPDLAFERLKEANPVAHPDLLKRRPTELATLITATTQGTGNTGTPIAVAPGIGVAPYRRPLVVALASACLILFVFLMVWAYGPTEPPVIGPPDTAPVAPQVPASADGTFQPTGTMASSCSGCLAVLLEDGRVLVVGGFGQDGPIAELFDPASWTFSETGAPVGQLSIGREGSAVRLLDGRVFFSVLGEPMEIYDPTSGSFTDLGRSGDGSAATLLPDGQVLVVGPATAVLFDPATGTFAPTGAPKIERFSPILVALSDGRVLVLGGDPSGSAEIYDPVTASFSTTGTMQTPRDAFTATRLLDGQVLIVGGAATQADTPALASAELYDPATGSFRTTGSLATSPVADGIGLPARFWHAAALLQDGRVIVVGGTGGTDYAYPDAEIYDPANGQFSPIASTMTRTRISATAVTLADGRVLILGSYPRNGGSSLGSRSAEIFSVDTLEPPSGCCAPNPTDFLVTSQSDPGPSGQRWFKVVVPPGGLAGSIEAFFTYTTADQGGGGEWPLPTDCVEGCEVVLPEQGETVSLQIIYDGTPPPQAKQIVIVESAFPASDQSEN